MLIVILFRFEAGRPSWKEEVYVVRQLLSSGPVWAIIAAQYGQSWGMIGA